jgi:hypothetical protein
MNTPILVELDSDGKPRSAVTVDFGRIMIGLKFWLCYSEYIQERRIIDAIG